MHFCRSLDLIWSFKSFQGYIHKIPGASVMILICQRGLFVSFPFNKITPSRSALEMHQDPCWDAKICAILIYSSAPSLQPSDCFKICTGALIFVRAWLIQRVWSIMGFKPYFLGPDKVMDASRPTPATAREVPIISGIAKISWVDWSHCRRLKVAGDVGTPLCLLLQYWRLVFFDFYTILISFLQFLSSRVSPGCIEGICKLDFHCIVCFLWFSSHSQSESTSILCFLSS